MRQLIEIAHTGIAAVTMHPLRSATTICALMAVLVPFVTGIGLSHGIRQEAADSIRFGADLYVSGTQFGRAVPLPLSTASRIAGIDGVADVVPRIVGGLVLGRNHERAVLVGIPLGNLPPTIRCVEGTLYANGSMNELVVGSQLARRLGLRVGSVIPPFYQNAKGERVSKVVGVFDANISMWSANLIFTSFETASAIFDQSPRATCLLVYCRPGHANNIKMTILRKFTELSDEQSGIRPRVIAKDDLESLVPAELLHGEGIFSLHFLLAFSVAILVVLVTSGAGLSPRRREIGILKATGWQTDEVLWRYSVESLLLSLTGASASVIVAYVWLKGLNGYWIAGIFLPGVGRSPGFDVPFRLTPVPVLLAFIVSFVVVMSGTVYSSWRAATVPPREAMR